MLVARPRRAVFYHARGIHYEPSGYYQPRRLEPDSAESRANLTLSPRAPSHVVPAAYRSRQVGRVRRQQVVLIFGPFSFRSNDLREE